MWRQSAPTGSPQSLSTSRRLMPRSNDAHVWNWPRRSAETASPPEDESPSSPEDENDTNGSAHLDHDALPGRTKICNDRDERAAKAGSGLPAARRWPTMSNQMGRRGAMKYDLLLTGGDVLDPAGG